MIVFDSFADRARSFKEDVQGLIKCDCVAVAGPEEACECDILVTTTPSRSPVVNDKWILPGTHINAIGADAAGKQELQSTLLKRATVVVDALVQAVHSGEINVPISKGTSARRRSMARSARSWRARRPEESAMKRSPYSTPLALESRMWRQAIQSIKRL